MYLNKIKLFLMIITDLKDLTKDHYSIFTAIARLLH